MLEFVIAMIEVIFYFYFLNLGVVASSVLTDAINRTIVKHILTRFTRLNGPYSMQCCGTVTCDYCIALRPSFISVFVVVSGVLTMNYYCQ